MKVDSISAGNTLSAGRQKDISVTPVLYGQEVAGWITSTQTSDGIVYYGPFATCEEGLKWAQNLINAVVEPVYQPAFNRG